MTQIELNTAIEKALQLLADTSWDLFDAWYERLHNVQLIGNVEHIEVIESEHNETNLNLMIADYIAEYMNQTKNS